MGLDETCRDAVLPAAWLMCTLNTILTRVFLRPMSVSPFLSSMSELRSFKIPAQSILRRRGDRRRRVRLLMTGARCSHFISDAARPKLREFPPRQESNADSALPSTPASAAPEKRSGGEERGARTPGRSALRPRGRAECKKRRVGYQSSPEGTNPTEALEAPGGPPSNAAPLVPGGRSSD
ncbi:hypothetical protein EYF80_020807 [Liparis tanakae]|uniref:Uncharacterized protein n=1 Tax=Liparis tanakae TaxID=230148 RepID=A0A4Z2HSW1_9TELE|nr:hypothetical protein EYF80_020807 [Liparis tanakae]